MYYYIDGEGLYNGRFALSCALVLKLVLSLNTLVGPTLGNEELKYFNFICTILSTRFNEKSYHKYIIILLVAAG